MTDFPEKTDVSKLTFDDLPVGTHVKIISKMVDMYFFYGETGIVIRNSGEYLGIIVKFDKPRYFKYNYNSTISRFDYNNKSRNHYEYIQEDFNFNPENLEII